MIITISAQMVAIRLSFVRRKSGRYILYGRKLTVALNLVHKSTENPIIRWPCQRVRLSLPRSDRPSCVDRTDHRVRRAHVFAATIRPVSKDGSFSRNRRGIRNAIQRTVASVPGRPRRPALRPKARDSLFVDGQHLAAIGAVESRPDLARVSQGIAAQLAAVNIPKALGIVAGGEQRFAIGTETHSSDRIVMSQLSAQVITVSTCQIVRAVLSATRSTNRPSGLKAAASTSSPCSSGRPTGLPEATSHSRAVSSSPPVTTVFPSALIAAARIDVS